MMRRILLPAMLLLLMATPARAVLQGNATMMAPNQDNRQVSYLRVTVQNPTGDRIGYRLKIYGYSYGMGNNEFALRDQVIGPGMTVEHHLALPFALNTRIEMTDTSDDSPVFIAVNQRQVAFLNVAEVNRWADEATMQDFTSRSGLSGGHHGSSSKPNYVAQLEPDQLPDRWSCYSAFRAVFIDDPAWRNLPGEAKEPLMQWVGAGGQVMVYGTGRAETEPHLLGEVIHLPGSPFGVDTGLNPRALPDSMEPLESSNQVIRSLPFEVETRGGRTGAFLLATVFCIVAGPVNYGFWRKRGRIRMLLVSVPVLSLICCLLITGYFVATQGFARRGGTFAMTLLDEGADRAVTYGHHLLYSGLYPLGGFEFEPDTLFYPLTRFDEDNGFRMEFGGTQRLTSGLFRPSVAFHYWTARPWQTRERLIVDPVDRSVVNGFEGDIVKAVVVLDGAYYQATDLDSGAKATLEPVDPGVIEIIRRASGGRILSPPMVAAFLTYEEINMRAKANAMMDHEKLQFTDYGVVLAEPLEAEEPGLNISQGEHAHILAGQFDPAVEAR